MRYTNSLVEWTMYPSQKSLQIKNPEEKKQAIVNELLEKMPTIRSFHGVPAWPLGIIDELISQDLQKAKQILKACEYVSI